MQDHYIQIIGEKIGISHEILRTQYIKYAKNEGKFVLQQKSRQKEPKYEIQREMLVAALFYQEFIHQYIDTQDKRKNIIECIQTIQDTLPNNNITKTINDPDQASSLIELQLRREKELTDKDEEKKYHTIKQIILPTIQWQIKIITKDTHISSDIKQHILNLTKKI